MKRVITALVACTAVIVLFCGRGQADSPVWTFVPVPASDRGGIPVFFDTDSYLGSDITTDINGNLYVMSDSRIIRFTPEGKLDKSWGGNGIIYDGDIKKTWSEQLDFVADSRGYVYAECRICEDGSPTYIKRYSPDGKVDTSWYGDGVMGGKVGEEWIEEDEKEIQKGGVCYQDDIALDSKDNLYVLYDREVYKFLPDGKPDKSWRKLKMKQPKEVYDDGGYGVRFDNALCIDWNDNIYLFNGYDRTVSRYDSSGKLKKKEKCGLYYYEDEWQHYLLNQMAFDAEGNIYYGNFEGNTVAKYSLAYKQITDWGKDGILTIGASQPVQTTGVFTSDAKGDLYILNEENAVISKYTSGGKLDDGWGYGGSIGNVNTNGILMPYISGIAFDTDGSMYINDLREHKMPMLKKFAPDFTPEDWTPMIDKNTKQADFDEGIEYITPMATFGGMLYIEQYEAGSGSVIRIKSDGSKDEGWGIELPGAVIAIAADIVGNIYVADSTDTVMKYTPDGKADKSWGSGIKAGEYICGITVDIKGYVYVCREGDGTVSKFTPGGKRDVKWGRAGFIVIPSFNEDSDYDDYGAISIAVDDACNLYVCNPADGSIMRYNAEGLPDSSWCVGGVWKSDDSLWDSPAPLINPTHIDISRGKLYAVWNGKLYVMSDSVANLGVKEEAAAASHEPALQSAAPTGSSAGSVAPVDNNGAEGFNWPLAVLAVALVLSGVLIIGMIKAKKK